MTEDSAFDRLMHEVCVERSWCGGIVDGRSTNVFDFLPDKGTVTAAQFAAWLFAADGVNPDKDRAKWQPQIVGLQEAFVRHMGAEQVDVGCLTYSGGQPPI